MNEKFLDRCLYRTQADKPNCEGKLLFYKLINRQAFAVCPYHEHHLKATTFDYKQLSEEEIDCYRIIEE